MYIGGAAGDNLAVFLPEDFGTAVVQPFGYTLLLEASTGGEGAFRTFMFLLEPYHLIAELLSFFGQKPILSELHQPRGVLAVESVGGLVTRTVAPVMGHIERLEAFRSRGVVDLGNNVRMVNTCSEVRILLYNFLCNLGA